MLSQGYEERDLSFKSDPATDLWCNGGKLLLSSLSFLLYPMALLSFPCK